MNLDVNVLGPYALVILAGLFAHATYQLSLSILSLIHSHAIGAGRHHGFVMTRSIAYILGSFVATLGLVVLATNMFASIIPIDRNPVAWILVCALVFIVGCATVLFYYRRGKGTRLWLPRKYVEFISGRAKQVTNGFESFSLGLAMVLSDLPYLIAPIVLAGAVLSSLPRLEHTVGALAYSFAAILPLIFVTVLVGGGHKISEIQRWRETNKHFLQWTSGLTLVLLSIYLFAMNIWGKSA